MIQIDFYTFIAILGLAHTVFLIFLFRSKKNRTIYNQIFSLFLIAASIRITKDLLLYLIRIDETLVLTSELWIFIENFGYANQFALGPLLFLYFKYILNPDFKFDRIDLLHFIPFASIMILLTTIKWSFWQTLGLHISYFHLLSYFSFAVLLYKRSFAKEQSKANHGLKNWLKYMLIIIFVLMLSYMPTMFKYIGYIAGAVVYSFAIFALSFILFKGNKLAFTQKYKSSSLTAERRRQIRNKLNHLFESESAFLDSTLSLKILATQLEISTTHLSQIINEEFNKNFSDYINSYRVDHIKTMLADEKNANFKIAYLAFEGGFESLSSFNSVFKKHTGSTPSQYRAELEGKKLN